MREGRLRMADVNTRTVLIIEDTDDMARFVSVALEDLGLETYHANTPEKAIDFLENHRPDLIILDIGLPEMSGWQLLEIIQEWRTNENVFVLVTTAFTDPANRLIGKLQHVDGYLYKPFAYKELTEMVRKLFEA